jgi:hypothetical protein
MSNFLSSLKVSNSVTRRPYFMVIYSAGGVGKTGLCLYSQDPFYVGFEPGIDWVPSQKFVDNNGLAIIPKDVDQAYDMIKWLIPSSNRDALEKPIRTVVIDSLGFFQDLVYADIVAKNPFTKGKEPKKVTCIQDLGYDGMGMAMSYWDRLLKAVDVLQSKGLNVIMITHSHRVNVTGESGESYKIIDMDLQSYGSYSVPELLKRRADWVYYLTNEVSTVTTGTGNRSKTSAIGNSTAQMRVQTRASSLAFAKCRPEKEENIPDFYYLSAFDREEVATKIFNDIIGIK